MPPGGSDRPISRALADQSRTIRIPVHMVETIGRLLRVQRQLLQEIGREPTPEEIGAEMGISAQRVREILKIGQEPISLETPVGEEEDSQLADFIKDDEAIVPLEAVSETMQKEELEAVLGKLTHREREIIELRFGLKQAAAHPGRGRPGASASLASASARSRPRRWPS